MRHAVCLIALVALVGCAGPEGAVAPPIPTGGATPRQAILYRDTVTVQFSDGTLCVALRPATARIWGGQLAGCPHMATYQVTLPPGPQAARRILVRLDGGGTAVLRLDDAAFGLPGPV
ncbi:MAG: hypothetical protein GW905_07600 [Rhodobacterales bacterium]|nr:hypothetical protein [Rhodobacterales bacterium]